MKKFLKIIAKKYPRNKTKTITDEQRYYSAIRLLEQWNDKYIPETATEEQKRLSVKVNSARLLIDLEKQKKCFEKLDEIMDKLYIAGIETRPGTHAVHTLSYYKNRYNFLPEDFPNTYKAFSSTISLPFHNYMTKEDIEYVSDNILKAIYDLR